jgi:hypothetical protein
MMESEEWRARCLALGATPSVVDTFISEALATAYTLPVSNTRWVVSQCERAIKMLCAGLPMPETQQAAWDWENEQFTQQLFINLDIAQRFARTFRTINNPKTKKIWRYLRSR